MKRLWGFTRGVLLFTMIVAVAAFAVQCGRTKAPEKTAEAARPIMYFHVDPATAATLRGKITFHGARPARQTISMAADAACEKVHAGHPVYAELIVTGKGNGLANAFVYVQSGLEGKNFEPVTEAASLDQRGCMFVPRVIGIRTGQTLDVKNSDPVSHNIHPRPSSNREWNQEQPPQSPDLQHRFGRREIMIPVKCDIHSWMRAYIGVMEHPYFTVTGPDGTFAWTGVPPGDYTVAVWHETLGEQTRQIHLTASAGVVADFTYR